MAWVGPEPLLSQGAAGQKSQLQRGGTGGAPWTCVLAGGTQQRLADQEGAHVALFSGGEGLVGGRAPERGARHCARKRRAVAWRPRAFAAQGASVGWWGLARRGVPEIGTRTVEAGPANKGGPAYRPDARATNGPKGPIPPPHVDLPLKGGLSKRAGVGIRPAGGNAPKGLALSPVIGTSWRPVDSEGSPVCERGKFKDLETLSIKNF